ncbi:hypothetical protein [Aquitalea magnusonii]|uniref:hypothetical protein n=1 Tax=Aquitalea magnusonii TaxID=332411 RepID=UPI0011B53F15|nr:hypothetical protein [Aquitalea magnusonii]
MDISSIGILRIEFWKAPDEAFLPRNVVAAGIDHSISWLEAKATHGGGPLMRKYGRRVLYCKKDVLVWLSENFRPIAHTSELAIVNK